MTWRNLFRHRVRTSLTVVGVSVGVVAIVALGAILAVMPQRGSGRPAVSVAEIALSEEPAEVAGEPPVVAV